MVIWISGTVNKWICPIEEFLTPSRLPLDHHFLCHHFLQIFLPSVISVKGNEFILRRIPTLKFIICFWRIYLARCLVGALWGPGGCIVKCSNSVKLWIFRFFQANLCFFRKITKGYGTQGSQAVTHPSTNWACGCLTSEIERDRVHSTEYGRIHE